MPTRKRSEILFTHCPRHRSQVSQRTKGEATSKTTEIQTLYGMNQGKQEATALRKFDVLHNAAEKSFVVSYSYD